MARRHHPQEVTFLVDPSMYDEGYSTPREVYGDLDRVVRPDLYYHYATPICAQRWLDVCDDPDYGHGALLDAIRAGMPRVAAALAADAGRRRRLHLYSLGPGDGSVDLAILQGLGTALEPASYTGLDFSFELLRRSVHRIAHAPELPAGLRVRAVCGDFTELGSLPLEEREHDGVRVFALTGFTLGNYPEGDLLDNIGALMSEGDYLFLDARLHGFGRLPGDLATLSERVAGAARSSYDLPSVRRFVLGPVEVATTATADSVEVCLEADRRATVVPNGLNLVLYCTGLDAVMRLTGERIRRARLDLAVTTSYHLPDLADWLEGVGFHAVWREERDDMAFFLLRR